MRMKIVALALVAAVFCASCQTNRSAQEFSRYQRTYGKQVTEPSDATLDRGDYADDTRQIEQAVPADSLWNRPIKELACTDPR